MSHKPLHLKEGALILSDAHYSELRPDLLVLIEMIHATKILTPQLILMGDIFDALFGSVTYTAEKNSRILHLLNEISMKIEVVYLEGNHDFNLKEYFQHMRVFPLQEQPVEALYGDRKVLLAHGDFNGNWSYKLYCKLIRNSFLVKFLTLVDTVLKHKILKKLDAYLAKKEDCSEFIGFREFVMKRRLETYKGDYFIEGHYHQNKQFVFDSFTYINLGAFACNQRYFVVKSLPNKELLEEKRLLKGDVENG